MTGPIVSLASVRLAQDAGKLKRQAARAGFPGGIMLGLAAANAACEAQAEYVQAYGKRGPQ